MQIQQWVWGNISWAEPMEREEQGEARRGNIEAGEERSEAQKESVPSRSSESQNSA